MSKVTRVMVLAVVIVLITAASAFADHSPTFYVEWNQSALHTGYNASFGNQGTGSPHQNYLEGTEKCGVCHSVHRAPVPYQSWTTSGTPGAQTPAQKAVRTPVAGGQYNRAEWVSDSDNTQMLLLDSVANSCNFCHVYTSIGNKQLYAGNPNYINSEDALGTDEWDEGFGHHNGCTGCHAVHGVAQNWGNATLYGQYGTFQGPARTKILKVRAKGSGGAGTAGYYWQDEVITAGSLGAAEATTLYGALWAGLLTVDDAAVDPQNVPLFPSATDAIMGNNVRPGGFPVKDAQVSAFCTFCHQNYGWASEATVNPDGDRSLFQGPWYALAGTVPNVAGTAGTWQTMNAANGYRAPFKNHPLRNANNGSSPALTFQAAGKSSTVPGQVAYANSDTCRTCHDAGLSDVVGCIIQSWPHFTPGYFHFTKSASHVGAAMTNVPPIPDVLAATDSAGIAAVQAWLNDPVNYEEAVTVQDGQCLKCHVNAADTAGVGKTY